MKKIICSVGICLVATQIHAQVVNRTDFYIGEDAVLSFGQDVVNEGKIINNGKIYLQANINNNGVIASKGEVVFDGINKQTIRGEKEMALANVILENDVRLETSLRVTEQVNFRRGVVECTSQAPIIFEDGAKHSGASDYSHVRGVIKKEGGSTFEFPLGDGKNYRSFMTQGADNQTLIAEYVAKSPLYVSGVVQENVVAINKTEYWSLRSDALASARVSIANSSDLSEIAFLKRGTWEVKEDATLSASNNGTLFTMARSRNEKPSIDVWPNPTEGEFNLKLTGLKSDEMVTVNVTDQSGVVVLKKEGRVADLRRAYELPGTLAAKELNIIVTRGDNKKPLYQKLFLNK